MQTGIETLFIATITTFLCIGLYSCQSSSSDMTVVKQSLTEQNGDTAALNAQSSEAPLTDDEKAARKKVAKPIEEQDVEAQRRYYEAQAMAEKTALKTQQDIYKELKNSLNSVTGDERTAVQKELDALSNSMKEREKRIKEADAKSK
jgi:hypothetical protein